MRSLQEQFYAITSKTPARIIKLSFYICLYYFPLLFLDMNLRPRDNFVVKMGQLQSRQLRRRCEIKMKRKQFLCKSENYFLSHFKIINRRFPAGA